MRSWVLLVLGALVAVLARLALPERCGAGSLLDRRRPCTDATAHPDGQHVTVYASIG